MSDQWEIISIGIDYLRVTGKKSKGECQIGRVFRKCAVGEIEAGNNRTVSRRLGYTGESVGKWFYGVRDDGCMLQVSGNAAGRAFEALRGVVFRTTRIDLQITVRSRTRMPMWAREVSILARGGTTREFVGRRPKMPFIDGDGEGDTLLFGSRASSRHGRLYDKEMESLDPSYKNCWRYEVEYKGDMAPPIVAHLTNAPQLDAACYEIVAGQFERWGAPLPVRPLAPGLVLRVPVEESDDDRTRRWLFTQVLPTLARLVDDGKASIVDELMKHAYNGDSPWLRTATDGGGYEPD